MDKQLLELQNNIFEKINEQANRIESKIANELRTMTKDINNIKQTLNKQEESINNMKKDVEIIPDIRKRIETLEKKIAEETSYSAAASTPKPEEKKTEGNRENKREKEKENTSPKTNIEVLSLARKIVGLFPIDYDDIGKHIDANNPDEKIATRKAAEEYLVKELGFRSDEVKEMEIKETNRPRKVDSNTVYITLKDAESAVQIFRSAVIRNNDLRVKNYVAPQFFAHYSALQLFTKQARELDDELRTKVQLGQDDIILLTKKVGERGYTKQPLDKYGPLPDFDNTLMWPLPEPIPLCTPPKGRSHKKGKRSRPSPNNLSLSTFA